jgi:hypothetical protein
MMTVLWCKRVLFGSDIRIVTIRETPMIDGYRGEPEIVGTPFLSFTFEKFGQYCWPSLSGWKPTFGFPKS